MTRTEEQLRDALFAEAEQYQASPDLWARIVAPRRSPWRFVLPSLAAAASLAAVGAFVLLRDEGPERIVTVPPAVTVTTAPTVPYTVECSDIQFAPNSDNVAAKIRYSALDLSPDKQQAGCAEATALVRKAATTHNFYSGPRTFQLDGWQCTVGTDEDELPVGHYFCTLGNRHISWDKT